MPAEGRPARSRAVSEGRLDGLRPSRGPARSLQKEPIPSSTPLSWRLVEAGGEEAAEEAVGAGAAEGVAGGRRGAWRAVDVAVVGPVVDAREALADGEGRHGVD